MSGMEKQKVTLLVTEVDVVSFDDNDTLVSNGAIAIEGNTIVWIGLASEAAGRFTATETIRAEGMIAMPGFIDCHVHTAQQFLHGKLASIRRRGELRSPMWQRYLIPFESGLEPERRLLQRSRRLRRHDPLRNHHLPRGRRTIPRRDGPRRR